MVTKVIFGWTEIPLSEGVTPFNLCGQTSNKTDTSNANGQENVTIYERKEEGGGNECKSRMGVTTPWSLASWQSPCARSTSARVPCLFVCLFAYFFEK